MCLDCGVFDEVIENTQIENTDPYTKKAVPFFYFIKRKCPVCGQESESMS